MLNKSAHLDRFVSTHSANLTMPSVVSPRARKSLRSEAYFSAKFWGLLVAVGFSVVAWAVVFRLVTNFLHAS
jgi:hypothetical protein